MMLSKNKAGVYGVRQQALLFEILIIMESLLPPMID